MPAIGFKFCSFRTARRHDDLFFCHLCLLQASQLAGVRQVQLGLERSADEGNGVFVDGQEVNHQFDKSSAFLAQAQEYIHRFIDPDMKVVSTLHGLWEIQVSTCALGGHYYTSHGFGHIFFT
ncbi:MAG: hypothetical protein WBJ81_06450 [Rickettsiales bacterium]